jgi:hypothetical protein
MPRSINGSNRLLTDINTMDEFDTAFPNMDYCINARGTRGCSLDYK